MACDTSSAGAWWQVLMDNVAGPGYGLGLPGEIESAVTHPSINMLPSLNPYTRGKKIFGKVKDVFKCGVSGLFSSCDNHRTNVISSTIYNEIIAQSFFQVIGKCDSSVSSHDWMVMNCDAKQETVVPGKPYGENLGCRACLIMKAALTDNRRELEAKAFELNPSHVMDTMSGNIAAKWGDSTTFPCIYACQSCVFQNLQQKSQIFMTQHCQQNAHWVDALKQRIQGNVQQTLKDQKDAFGALGDLLTPDSVNCIVSDVTTRLQNAITNEFTNRVLVGISNWQNITVDPGSNSLYVNKVKQTINVNSITSLVAQEKITSNLYSSTELQEAQTLFDKNDTVGDIARAIQDTIVGVDRLFKSMITKLLIIVGVVLFGVIIFLIVVVSMQPKHEGFNS